MDLKHTPEERQREIATEIARAVQHDGRTLRSQAERFELGERAAAYLLRKFGFGSARNGVDRAPAPLFLRRGGYGPEEFDRILDRRRGGETWESLAGAYGFTGKTRVHSFFQTIKRFAVLRGHAWPLDASP